VIFGKFGLLRRFVKNVKKETKKAMNWEKLGCKILEVSIEKAFLYSLGPCLRNNVPISLHKFIKVHEFKQILKPDSPKFTHMPRKN
jgi:hypothetical protein